MLFFPLIVIFFMVFNLTLLMNLRDENKALQDVLVDFKNVSRDLYAVHESMLNMTNADQAFIVTGEISFLKQFIQSSIAFKANIYSLKQSLISLPLAYKVLEEVEVTLLQWLNISYPEIKKYEENITPSAARQLSQSLDPRVQIKAIKQMTDGVALVKNMWYEHVIDVVKHDKGQVNIMQLTGMGILFIMILSVVLFMVWIRRL